jgi:FMN phosphatase YigB (HAD superfamily)
MAPAGDDGEPIVMAAARIMFLLDVDNTLLDNDRFGADLGDTLEQAFGARERTRYWAIYDELRESLGYADYLGALQRFRAGLENEPALLQMSRYLLDYPFAERLYPDALATIAHLRSLAPTAILSDGDMVFQPR